VPPTRLAEFDQALVAALDGFVAGDTGGLDRPTGIRDARSGAWLRA
jgi:L-threonylcarbamoyladenylate synthase